MKPRNLYYHALMAIHTVLLLAVAVVSWWDNRSATLRTRRALSGYEDRLEALSRQVVSSLSAPARVRSSRETRETSLVDSSLSASPRVASGWRRLPPRVLGTGRSRNWVYVDVAYADGAVRRHYVRAGASPAEVKSFVRQLASEAGQHSWVLDSVENGS